MEEQIHRFRSKLGRPKSSKTKEEKHKAKLESQRKWYSKNKERSRAYSKSYYRKSKRNSKRKQSKRLSRRSRRKSRS